MAEAIFEEHPLEQYLRDAGEVHELMPGTSLELIQEIDIDRHLYEDLHEGVLEGEMEWRPPCLIVGLNALESFLSSAKPSSPCNPFVERFKYSVISSSLLSTSLSNPNSHRSSLASIPGRLNHTRTTSLDLDAMKSEDGTLKYTPSHHYGPISIAALATALFAGMGSRFLATLSLGCLSYFAYHHIRSSEAPCHDFTPTFNALDELVLSNATWETTVQDALQVLEKEESHLLRTSTPSSTPTNALRVSVNSTLQTTRTQCDNVRQLFSALTCPTELAQLSEMYAPPSPMKSPLSLVETSPRPYSFPSRNMNLATPQNKRSTWHASYAELASIGSPPSGLRKREKHRSGVSTLFQPEPPTPSTASGPVTPSPLSPLPVYSLGQIAEDITVKGKDESDVFIDEDMFGPAALNLQRKRQIDGVGALSPPPSRDFRTPRTRRLSAATLSSSSRFTNSQAPRHPLSLFTLQQSLQGAVSSKRYACSHLLALRFNEDEEEYWENVRSMMELLTTTFTEEAARLAEALEYVERQHLRDQNPTPDISQEFENLQKVRTEGGRDRNSWSPRGLSALVHERGGSTSFAPMPSHLSRFAAHVASIMSSLEDAREHLRDCVDSLKDDSQTPLSSTPSTASPSRSRTGSEANEDGNEQEHRAILAYERLRRELGLALRECERGRQNLVDIVHPPPTPSSDDEGSDGVPGFGHDPSDDSDKLDPVSPSEDEDDAALHHRPATVLLNGDVLPQEDDVTSHLLSESSIQALLAPQGIDQVYEADTGSVGIYTRERSKMGREERIRLMKARREAAAAGTSSTSGSGEGLGLFDGPSKSGKREGWGPGGEVVQELKDVIWKVGEKRRKMQEQFRAQAHTQKSRESGRLPEVTGMFEPADREVTLPPLPDSPSPVSPRLLALQRAGVLLESS